MLGRERLCRMLKAGLGLRKGTKCSMRQTDHRSMKSLSYSKHVQPSLNRLHQEHWEGACDVSSFPGWCLAQYGLGPQDRVSFTLSPICWPQLPAAPSHIELNKQPCSAHFPTLPPRASSLDTHQWNTHASLLPHRGICVSVLVFL